MIGSGYLAAMIKVVLFANLKEDLGAESVCLEATGISTVQDVIEKLAEERGANWLELLTRDNILVAVNKEMMDRSAAVATDDEVAFLPPVSGG